MKHSSGEVQFARSRDNHYEWILRFSEHLPSILLVQIFVVSSPTRQLPFSNVLVGGPKVAAFPAAECRSNIIVSTRNPRFRWSP
jgi:hypothetical protein